MDLRLDVPESEKKSCRHHCANLCTLLRAQDDDRTVGVNGGAATAVTPSCRVSNARALLQPSSDGTCYRGACTVPTAAALLHYCDVRVIARFLLFDLLPPATAVSNNYCTNRCQNVCLFNTYMQTIDMFYRFCSD